LTVDSRIPAHTTATTNDSELRQKPPSWRLVPDPEPNPVPDPYPVPAEADKIKDTNPTIDLSTTAVTAKDTDIRAASNTPTECVTAVANSATEAAAVMDTKSSKPTADTATVATDSREMTATTQRGESREGAASTDAAAASGQQPEIMRYRNQ
jgi:hypothetical protein